MADKLRLGYGMHELKLGASFTNNKAPSFHTLKCDFKPASVDPNKMASLDVGTNNQVTVTFPHLDGSGVPQTVFKGNQKSYQKECVLIINRVTGELTLERLSTNIQVKKTRQEPPQKPAPLSSAHRPHTPVDPMLNLTQRSTSRTRVTSGKRTNQTKTIQMSPPRHRTSPPQVAPWTASAGQSTLASLPMIGLDDDMHRTPEPILPPVQQQPSVSINGHMLDTRNTSQIPNQQQEVGVLSSSSDSSSSDSDNSDSDSDANDAEVKRPINNTKPDLNGGMNGINLGISDPTMSVNFLNDDLCLSESGSDDDD